MSYLCDLFFNFRFHYNHRYNVIDTDKFLVWTFLSKVQLQGAV